MISSGHHISSYTDWPKLWQVDLRNCKREQTLKYIRTLAQFFSFDWLHYRNSSRKITAALTLQGTARWLPHGSGQSGCQQGQVSYSIGTIAFLVKLCTYKIKLCWKPENISIWYSQDNKIRLSLRKQTCLVQWISLLKVGRLQMESQANGAWCRHKVAPTQAAQIRMSVCHFTSFYQEESARVWAGIHRWVGVCYLLQREFWS